MNMKKILALLTVCATVVTSLAACGKTPDAAESSTKESVKEENKEQSSESSAQVEEKEEVTISGFVMQAINEGGLWEGYGAKRLFDDLKIKIEFDPSGDESEAFLQQYLVAGDLPDFIGVKGNHFAQQMIDAQTLLPLNEYADKLPNIFENDFYKEAIEKSVNVLGGDAGNLYVLPSGISHEAYMNYNCSPQLQYDAYKNIGMPKISTFEDFLDVVEQMVAYKPTTENGEKVYGFSLFSDWDALCAQQVTALAGLYGVDSEGIMTLLEPNYITKEMNSILDEDSYYKRGLKFFFEANQRGLLDPDSMTQGFLDSLEKVGQGRAMFSWYYWFTGYGDGITDSFVGVYPEDAKTIGLGSTPMGNDWYFAISKDTENLDAALEFLNWLYDPEVSQFIIRGPQGVVWDYNAEGVPEVLDWTYFESGENQAELPEEVGGGKMGMAEAPFNNVPLSINAILDGYTLTKNNWPTTLEHNLNPVNREYYATLGDNVYSMNDHVENNDLCVNELQARYFVNPAGDDLQLIMTQIGEGVKKYSWQMIYAEDEAEFESIWDTMVSEAEQLGLKQVIDYYTEQWNIALEK